MPAHILLLLAFAFTVMADPISSVAYAIEAALRGLGGNLALLLPTMALVIVVIAIVTVNYHQLVARFPDGGSSAAASGAAFGEAWSFLPIGALGSISSSPSRSVWRQARPLSWPISPHWLPCACWWRLVCSSWLLGSLGLGMADAPSLRSSPWPLLARESLCW